MSNSLVATALLASLGVAACTHEGGQIAGMPRSGLVGHEVTVTTADGTEETADIEEVTLKHPNDPRADTDAVILRNTRDGAMFDETTLTKVEVSNHVLGAAEGLGIGALTGAVVGAVIGYAGGDDPPCAPDDWCILRFSAGDKAMLTGAALGGVGMLVGLVVGAVVGAHDVYRNGDAPRSAAARRARPANTFAITPVGPAGSVAGLGIQF